MSHLGVTFVPSADVWARGGTKMPLYRSQLFHRPSHRISLGLIFVAILSVLSFGQAKGPKPLKQDEACLVCHGQPGFKSDKNKDISVNPLKHAASVHGGMLGCTDCHTTIKDYPHPAKVAMPQCSTCHADESSQMAKSAHGMLGDQACQSCHGDAHEITTAAQLVPSKCSQCHEPEVKDFRLSIHGTVAAAGDHDAPNCLSCHGSIHQILPSSDPGSSVAKKNLPNTCATCHSNKDFLSRHNIPFAHPVELYEKSVHGRALASGNEKAAACSDCHTSHRILPGSDARSSINHFNIPNTCGQCHTEISKVYLESVHGQAMKAGSHDVPVCTDCHGEHLILGPKDAASPVSAVKVSTVTCGRCHNDERLAVRYNLPLDRVPSYADSYHGLANREGSQTVANCASCHGVHNIFPAKDSRSTVNAANLSKTCGACHSGAGKNFAIGPVHVQPQAASANAVVRWIRNFYLWIIPLTLGFMVLHNLIDLLAKLRRGQHGHSEGPMVTRMNTQFLIVHWGLLLSFAVLVVTGFALKYPGAVWAKPLLLWEGHFAFRGALHRAAAVLLMSTMAYHLITLAFYKKQREFLLAMLPAPRDATNIVQVFKYNLGLSKDQPQFARFNYAEKIEYWALLWGAVVMAVSGCLLWFTNFSLQHFPKWVTDAATAVHWYEAILATFSILLWHFYMVIFDPAVYPMDLAWLTGKVPAGHYGYSRPEYLHSLEQKENTEQVVAKEACEDVRAEQQEEPEMEEAGKGHTGD